MDRLDLVLLEDESDRLVTLKGWIQFRGIDTGNRKPMPGPHNRVMAEVISTDRNRWIPTDQLIYIIN